MSDGTNKQTNIALITDNKPEPNQFIVDQLQQCLDEAKSGKLQGIAVVGVYDDDSIFDCFYAHHRPHLLLGKMTVTMRDIQDAAKLPRERE